MKRNFWAAAIFVSCAAAQTPAPTEIAARLTPNNLKADVSFLASDALEGRGTPSPGLDIAAEFVASQFRGAGLEPAGDDGYFQTAPFVRVTPNRDGLRLTIGEATADAAAVSMVQAAAVDLTGADAFLALSTDGLNADQVRGKVLLLKMGGRVQGAALAALEPALVVILANNPNARAGGVAPQLRDPSSKPLPMLVLSDAAMLRAFDSAQPGPIAAKVTAHVGEPKFEPLKLRNVVGVLRGSDTAPGDAYILVTGHYDHLGVRGTGPGDHIFNGANDDASGTSSVIEIARTLGAMASRPKRSVVFVALFGEEQGLLGSRYYAAHPAFPLAKTVADFNLEQMGRTDDVTGPRVGILNATGFDYTDLMPVFEKAGEAFGIKVEKDEKSSDPFFSQSDNLAFANAGIPSTTFSVGYIFPDYHKAGDEWQKIDYENMAKVDRAIALGIWRIADSAEAPKWNAIDRTERYRRAAEGLRK